MTTVYFTAQEVYKLPIRVSAGVSDSGELFTEVNFPGGAVAVFRRFSEEQSKEIAEKILKNLTPHGYVSDSAAERARICSALRARHEQHKQFHNFYAVLANELEEGTL